jgi:hypothetical protein
MSITSINDQQITPDFSVDFSALLVHYPGLRIWLSEIVEHWEEWRTEALLRSFLGECASQGVPGDAYPFISNETALADLQAYLSRAQTELRAITEHASEARTELRTITEHASEAQAEFRAITEYASESVVAVASLPAALDIWTEATETVGKLMGVAEVNVERERLPEVVSSDELGKVQTQPRIPAKKSRPHRQQRRWTVRQRIIVWTLLILILGAILVPVGFLLNFGISSYNLYRSLSDEARSAVGHLLNVKTILTGSQGHLSAVLTSPKLQQVQKEFVASDQDFRHIQTQLRHSPTIDLLVTYFPTYKTTLKSAQAASAIGSDIAQIGEIVTGRLIQFAPTWSGPSFASSNKPLITQPMLNVLGPMLDQIIPLVNNMQDNAHNLSLSSLPLSNQEKAQIEPLLQQLPLIVSGLGLARNLLGVAGWLLGVDHVRSFLIQTMDRAELRGTGGFTGQYGELTIHGGRVAPFGLKDISQIEYTADSTNQGQTAPDQYISWWPFANWGLRDSNISADFPTSAKLALSLYEQETGHPVQGVISFTPVMIEHLLAIIGPIRVPVYNVTVTAQNLEDLLHYYQLDNSGIYKQKSAQPDNTSTSGRKRFTSYLATLFIQRMGATLPTKFFSIVQQVFLDLKTRDLQIYFANRSVESLLEHYGDAGQMDRSLTHDGLYVVQENLSASKASQYVQTLIHDTVTLDRLGGATHLLQLRLVYNQAGLVYGYDAYYDYLRVYVPPGSQLLSGDGFSSGVPLCGGGYGYCPVDGVYPGGELTCPSGQYQLGAAPPSLTGSNGAAWEALQTLGEPTNIISDEPGRAMYGGWVIVPKNCTMNVTLSWYVPPLSSQPYSLLVQRQAGTFPELDLTILPSAANCEQLGTSGLHFDDTLTQDASFTVSPNKSGTHDCYPQSSV